MLAKRDCVCALAWLVEPSSSEVKEGDPSVCESHDVVGT